MPAQDRSPAWLEGKGFRERRRGDQVVLRAWRMPVISAFVWCWVCPLFGAVLLYGVYAALIRRETERTDVVFGTAVLIVWLACLVAAGRSLTARVVADQEGLAVHGALGTIRVAWSDRVCCVGRARA